MPLTDKLPVIDNRGFDDIVNEARTRIPRYAPEWTNLNDSDPGMALVQLFAWMSDQLIYRLGKTPLQSYIKFLKLVGIEMNPASPARAEVTFPVVVTSPQPYIIVPLRTQISAEGAEGTPIVFETDRALTAITAELAEVMTYDAFSFNSNLQANEDALTGFQPFGPTPENDASLMLGFRYTGDFPPKVELSLAFWSPTGAPSAAVSSCGLPDTTLFASAKLAWEYWNGVEWATMSLLKDETSGFLRSGHVYLQTPLKGAMARKAFGSNPESLYWIRARINGGRYEKTPSLLAIRTNTVGVTQAITVRDEVLGTSSGRPDQVFTLADKPVLSGSLQLEINEGEGPEMWTEVQDFFGRGPLEKIYALNRSTGEIRFGNGEEGAIPLANLNDPGANIIARIYRWGGGKSGNVTARAIRNLMLSVEGIDANKVANLQAAGGGQDEESFDAVERRAPRAIRSRCRAVTSEDYEYFAMQVTNVKRARAEPLVHPSFPGVQVPGVVSVIIVPDADEGDTMPMPSEGTIRTVCAELNRRRTLTAEVFVVPPRYRRVQIEAEVMAEDSADLAVLKSTIDEDLLAYFHPLNGGEDGAGWPFGGDILYSRVSQRILRGPGARSIQSLLIRLDGVEQPECRDVVIEPGVLLYSTEHVLTVNYAFEE